MSLFLVTIINSLLFSLGLIAITGLLLAILSLMLPKLKRNQGIYFYSVASATLLINGFFGFYGEAKEKLETYAHYGNPLLPENIVSTLIFVSGAIIGAALFILLRLTLSLRIRKKGEIHSDHSFHDHSDHIISRSDFNNKKEAWIALLLILLHRGIDGFFFGSVVAKFSATNLEPINWGLVASFLFHSLFDIIIIYYHQVNYGETPKKAFLFAILSNLLLLPTLMLGAIIYPTINLVGWILPLVNVSGGTLLGLAGLVEFVPEFIHMRNEKPKKFLLVLISFAIGLIITVGLLQLDPHSH